jgi:leucyl aminopeptidase (aminopeptidase T)
VSLLPVTHHAQGLVTQFDGDRGRIRFGVAMGSSFCTLLFPLRRGVALRNDGSPAYNSAPTLRRSFAASTQSQELPMNHSLLRVPAGIAAGVFTLVIFNSAAVAADKPDLKAVAERVVGESARVKAGDRVVVRGDVRDVDLIEEISLAIWRRGAEPLQVLGREKAALRYFDEVPAAQDSVPLALSLKLVDVETVEIFVSGSEFPGLLGDVSAARMTATTKRMQPVIDARLKKGVRVVEVGNGLYPTDATAKRFGITKAQLADLYWSGLNVDTTKMQATGAAVRSALSAGKVVRVTHPNGTDLQFRIEGRPVNISSGVISDDAIAKGGPATQVWLPAGEVYTTPIKGTAKGKVVFDTLPFDDGELVGATYTFDGGKLVAYDAKPGAKYDRWKALYAAAPDGKAEFSGLDIGINPNVKVPAGSKFTSWVPAGTVSLLIGGNTWAGGDIAIGWSGGGSMNGCTVTVDGKTIVEGGVLKVK